MRLHLTLVHGGSVELTLDTSDANVIGIGDEGATYVHEWLTGEPGEVWAVKICNGRDYPVNRRAQFQVELKAHRHLTEQVETGSPHIIPLLAWYHSPGSSVKPRAPPQLVLASPHMRNGVRARDGERS